MNQQPTDFVGDVVGTTVVGCTAVARGSYSSSPGTALEATGQGQEELQKATWAMLSAVLGTLLQDEALSRGEDDLRQHQGRCQREEVQDQHVGGCVKEEHVDATFPSIPR